MIPAYLTAAMRTSCSLQEPTATASCHGPSSWLNFKSFRARRRRYFTFSSTDEVARFNRTANPNRPTMDGRRSNAHTIRDVETRAMAGEIDVASAASTILDLLWEPSVPEWRSFGFWLALDRRDDDLPLFLLLFTCL